MREQASLDELEGKSQHLQHDCEDAEISLKREQARLQRIGIERRNIEQANPQSSQALARLEELQQESESLIPKLKRRKTTLIQLVPHLEKQARQSIT